MDKLIESYSGDLRRVVSVSDFTRRASSYLQKLDGTRSPLLLTVNGRAAAVVQDAETYQEMVDLLRLLVRSVDSLENGERADDSELEELQRFVESTKGRELSLKLLGRDAD